MSNIINNTIIIDNYSYSALNSFLAQINELMLSNQEIKTNGTSGSQLWWINSWFYTYNSLISLTLMITVIFLIGLILPKTPRGVSTLNVLSAFSIFLFFFYLPLPHYNVVKHLFWFDYSLYVYLYIIIGGIFTASFLAINNEITFLKENKHIEYPLLILLVFLFGIVVVASENFIAVFLALEAITLISAVLIGFQRTNNLSTLAGIRYILFSAVPGGALLLGISELYAYTGAFNFADIEKLLMNYNDGYVNETTLDQVSQILYNSTDVVLYHNWDLQFNFFKDSLLNLDIFLKNHNTEFNNLILNCKSSSSDLEQLINYEFENSYKDSTEPVLLSLLGSYILQDNNNYDNNIKVGKYYIYKHIANNNYNNYSYEFLKNDKDIIDYCTISTKPNYKNPSYDIEGIYNIEEIKELKQKDSGYFYYPLDTKLHLFINFEPSVLDSVQIKTTVFDILSYIDEKKVFANYIASSEYNADKDLIQKLHPAFYNELLLRIDTHIKTDFSGVYVGRLMEIASQNCANSKIENADLVLNFLNQKKEYLENLLETVNNELNFNEINSSQSILPDFSQDTNLINIGNDSLNQYYYSLVENKLKVINTLIQHLNTTKVFNYDFVLKLDQPKYRNILLEIYYNLNNSENPIILNYDQFNDILENRLSNYDNIINGLTEELRIKYDFDVHKITDPNSAKIEDVLYKSELYYKIINQTATDNYPFNIMKSNNTVSVGDKPLAFKINIKSETVLNFDLINDYKADIVDSLSNKEYITSYQPDNVKGTDAMKLVTLNHTYTVPTIINISIFLIIFYILFKLTAAPFHIWAPSIYEGAPLPITIFLSIFSKITMIFLLIKLLVFYFYFLYSEWSTILLFSGLASIVVGIYGAISETRIKRFFVYSSMGHVGFMLLGISEGGVHGVLATVIYLMIYTVTVFIGWTILFSSEQKITHINQLSGLSKTNPTLSFILAISMLSMSGIPPLAGFYVKFEILYSLVESEYFNIALLALLLTVFSFFYYLRVIKILYFEPVKKFKLQFRLNKTQALLLAICFLFLINFSLYFQQPIVYIIKNIIIQSIY